MMLKKVLVTGPAQADIDEIWWRGFEQYNRQFADEYERLIKRAIQDLFENPHREGSRTVKDRVDGLRKYRIEHSRKSAGNPIKKPAHAIFYYVIKEETVLVSRILREMRELQIARIDLEGA